MTDVEKKFILKLLVLESDGLQEKQRVKIFKAFEEDLINFNNLQVCLDRIQDMRSDNLF